MKSVKILLSIALIGILVFACSQKKSEQEYYETAKNSYAKEDYKSAIAEFKELLKEYPKGKHAAEGLFMLGFINANSIKDYKEAEKYYKQFIKEYPDHQLRDDAEYELKYLGKDLNSLPLFNQTNQDSTK